jgi:hypothetical protein
MLVAAALLSLAPASLPEKPTGSEVEWSVTNFDASLVAKQTARGDGCHVEVRRDADQSLVWQRDVCLGGHSDPHLLSADGLRLIVLASLPSMGPETKDNKYPWRGVYVAWLFDKGTLQEDGTAGQFVKDPTEVRTRVQHFEWMQGVNKVPGVPPKLTSDGNGVEMDAIDGTHRVLHFSGLKLPPPAPLPEERKRRHHRH